MPPSQGEILGKPRSSSEGAAIQGDSPLWYFRGLPLAFDVLPDISRAGTGPESKEAAK